MTIWCFKIKNCSYFKWHNPFFPNNQQCHKQTIFIFYGWSRGWRLASMEVFSVSNARFSFFMGIKNSLKRWELGFTGCIFCLSNCISTWLWIYCRISFYLTSTTMILMVKPFMIQTGSPVSIHSTLRCHLYQVCTLWVRGLLKTNYYYKDFCLSGPSFC